MIEIIIYYLKGEKNRKKRPKILQTALFACPTLKWMYPLFVACMNLHMEVQSAFKCYIRVSYMFRPIIVMGTRLLIVILGSLSNVNGNSNKNVTWKYIFISLCYFVIISSRSTFTKIANYPGTKLVGVAYKLRNKIKNSPPCVHVLRKTLNVVISCRCFAEDDKETTKM